MDFISLQKELEGIRLFLKENEHKDDLIKRLHEELQLYKNGVRREWVLPLLKRMIQWREAMLDVHQHYSAQPQASDSALQKLLAEFSKMIRHVEDVLCDYDIEPFDAPVGEEYNAIASCISLSIRCLCFNA